MNRIRVLCLLTATLATTAAAGERRFEWTTKSAEARQLLSELQGRIESFQLGPANLELAQKLVAADPAFAIGQYYLSVVTPDQDEGGKVYDKSRELA